MSCTVTVADTTVAGTKAPPSGTVSTSSSGSGTLDASCTLVASATGMQSACTVTYTPTAVGTGTHTISATYQASAKHNGSTGFTDLEVAKRATSTAVTCTPATADGRRLRQARDQRVVRW